MACRFFCISAALVFPYRSFQVHRWAASRIPHLPTSVRHIRLLPAPGNSQVPYCLLRERLCHYSGLALIEDQRLPPPEVLLTAQEKGLPEQYLLLRSQDPTDPLENHQEQCATVLPPGAARGSAVLSAIPPEVAGLHLHPRL